MKFQVTLMSFSLSLFFFTTAEVQARQDLTSEQLTQAKELASTMKPPVNFEVMLQEADRLGVECNGDLTAKRGLRSCMNRVEIAQSEEKQAKLDEEAIQLIKEVSGIAKQKLQQ